MTRLLVHYKKALEYREEKGYAPNVRVAKWSVGHVLRLLGKVEEALKIQNNLIHEYETISSSGNLDMPEVMFKLVRGWVELAEIHNAKSKSYANLAYKDLANDEMFQKTSPERLERLKEKGKGNGFLIVSSITSLQLLNTAFPYHPTIQTAGPSDIYQRSSPDTR